MKLLRDFLIVVFLFALLVPGCTVDFDATDNAAGNKRSGFRLLTDYGTGCQYLLIPLGGLTPRMDENGKQVCKTEPEK